MSMGNNPAPAAGRDGVVRTSLMAVRGGMVLALLLGLGMMFGLLTEVVMFHMLAGLLVIGGLLVAGVRVLTQGHGFNLLGAALIGIAGAIVAMNDLAPGIAHLGMMAAAVGYGEMTAAKLKRAGH
jgi:hypothetical protein